MHTAARYSLEKMWCETDPWLLELLTLLRDYSTEYQQQRAMLRSNQTIILVINLHDLLMLFRSKSVHYEIVKKTNLDTSIAVLEVTSLILAFLGKK